MSTAALTTMLLVQVTVTCITAFFFYKVLITKPKAENETDSITDKL